MDMYTKPLQLIGVSYILTLSLHSTRVCRRCRKGFGQTCLDVLHKTGAPVAPLARKRKTVPSSQRWTLRSIDEVPALLIRFSDTKDRSSSKLGKLREKAWPIRWATETPGTIHGKSGRGGTSRSLRRCSVRRERTGIVRETAQQFEATKPKP